MKDCVLSRLWDWRDSTARKEDESPSFVLSNSDLVRIGLSLPTSLVQLDRSGRLGFTFLALLSLTRESIFFSRESHEIYIIMKVRLILVVG